MLSCFSADKKDAISIQLVTQNEYAAWHAQQAPHIKTWLDSIQFKSEPANACLLPDTHGKIQFALCCIKSPNDIWSVGNLPMLLPSGVYTLEESDAFTSFATVWGLGAYQFTRYKAPKKEFAKLYVSNNAAIKQISNIISSIHMVRDLINTPTDDMGPTQLAEAAKQLASQFHAEYSDIIGEELIRQNYAGIFTVGRASDDPPRLIDLHWGKANHPKVTLVGKGVCFDTGGLDIKPSNAMALMKKDMAGGAHALGLARMIMQANLPIRLRVLIPAVENAVSGNAYRPGDVIKSRQGKTIEIGNTDAEGRIILADALDEASREAPDLLIDLSTLTGAARIALGTELPAVFSNDQKLVDAVIKAGLAEQDLMWQLPLFPPYREYLNSPIADLNNCSSEPYAGAITAALFLQEFVPDSVPWLHFDMMAWNLRPRPGRPAGAEAMCLRALFAYLQSRFSIKS